MIGSDLLVQQLDALGIEYIALNPGATLAGLHESLLNGDGHVRPMTVLHEGVAVGMAHGYAKASGRPMAVGLHDTVGVLNAALGVFNAWADEVPMLILGGVGPLDGPARRPWIDWVHTTSDSPRPIRDSLVWAEVPSSLHGALVAMRRGHQRARSVPAGPAYVGLDVGLQGSNLASTPALPVLEPWTVAPDDAASARAAQLLLSASSPVIVTDRPLTDETAAAIVQLAERLGAAMVELEGAANVPWGHPLDRSLDREAALSAADVVVMMDVRDGGLVTRLAAGGGADATPRFIDISSAPLREASWMISKSDPGSALQLVGDLASAVSGLSGHLGEAGSLSDRLGEAASLDPAGPSAGSRPADAEADPAAALDRQHIAAAAGAVMPLDRVVVAHGALAGHTRAQLRLQRPSQYLGRSGGEGLGYALPASLGAALAHKGNDNTVIAFLTDGDTLYLPQALWTAARERIPLLAIIENNRTYWRDEIHQRAAAEERGRDPEEAARGVRLSEPDVDLTGLARSFGVAASDPATTVAELRAALKQGLEVVAGGDPFVVEALT